MIDSIQATHSTLLRALSQNIPQKGARILFLAAAPLADGALLEVGGSKSQLDCIQPWRNQAKILKARGYNLVSKAAENYDQVWILPGQHRDENRAMFAQALTVVREGGLVIAAMHNEIGAERFQKNFKQLFGSIESISKFHCRAFWAIKNGAYSKELFEEWNALNNLRIVEGTNLVAPVGVFSSQQIDRGSKVLAELLASERLSGAGADLGAGYGFLSSSILADSNHAISSLELVEADRRALEAALGNLAPYRNKIKLNAHWCDVTDADDVKILPKGMDWIVMNPPFHQKRQHAISLGQQFISVAAQCLRQTGVLLMVANEGLNYGPDLKSKFSSVTVLTHRDGFKVFKAIK